MDEKETGHFSSSDFLATGQLLHIDIIISVIVPSIVLVITRVVFDVAFVGPVIVITNIIGVV